MPPRQPTPTYIIGDAEYIKPFANSAEKRVELLATCVNQRVGANVDPSYVTYLKDNKGSIQSSLIFCLLNSVLDDKSLSAMDKQLGADKSGVTALRCLFFFIAIFFNSLSRALYQTACLNCKEQLENQGIQTEWFSLASLFDDAFSKSGTKTDGRTTSTITIRGIDMRNILRHFANYMATQTEPATTVVEKLTDKKENSGTVLHEKLLSKSDLTLFLGDFSGFLNASPTLRSRVEKYVKTDITTITQQYTQHSLCSEDVSNKIEEILTVLSSTFFNTKIHEWTKTVTDTYDRYQAHVNKTKGKYDSPAATATTTSTANSTKTSSSSSSSSSTVDKSAASSKDVASTSTKSTRLKTKIKEPEEADIQDVEETEVVEASGSVLPVEPEAEPEREPEAVSTPAVSNKRKQDKPSLADADMDEESPSKKPKVSPSCDELINQTETCVAGIRDLSASIIQRLKAAESKIEELEVENSNLKKNVETSDSGTAKIDDLTAKLTESKKMVADKEEQIASLQEKLELFGSAFKMVKDISTKF
jgi:methyl-accepting chemotaxis protein